MKRKKSFGQHFLHDTQVLWRIATDLQTQDDETVIEIGPGTGRLTKKLVEVHGAERVICVERDHDMIAHLAEKLPEVRVEFGDATKYAFDTLVPGPAVVCGNLPYNVSTGIYFHLLLTYGARFRRLVLMFQREVARRLIAEPGSKAYGPPSVLTALLADSRSVMIVPPRAFRPPPRVDSQVIRVDPLPAPRFGIAWSEVDALNTFVHGLFKQRRKTIHNNLKVMTGAAGSAALEQVGIDPRARAETLPPALLVELWRAVVGSA